MVSVIHPYSTQAGLRSQSSYSEAPPANAPFPCYKPFGNHITNEFNWRHHRPSVYYSSGSYTSVSSSSSYNHGCVKPQQRPKEYYSQPLFVDCSMEYELPNSHLIDPKSEPILMIHPAYARGFRGIKRNHSQISDSFLPRDEDSWRGENNKRRKEDTHPTLLLPPKISKSEDSEDT
eukprot:TRINITY_DN22456_c0_g1_i1.p1 TRINITY_DN22456_c0_g1~~TRINITY_DN22456_c0_g1_i1.p1  ORF type:complete len:176 (+),score=2.26 TRINITY_DN22456_c0_g1_i1:15-542(+)